MTTSAVDNSSIRRPTAKDVAKLAGVSTATVSRAVNGADNVSIERKAKVLNAVLQLQYCPNVYAAELGRANRNISKQRTMRAPSSDRHKGKRQI